MHRMRTTRNPERNLLLPSRIQLLLILQSLPSLVSDVANLTSRDMIQNAKQLELLAMNVSRLVTFRLCVAALADFPEECRNLILPIERQHILFQVLQGKFQLDSTMSKVIEFRNLRDLQFKQFTLFQLCIQSFRTFRTFIQKLIQNFCPHKEWHNLKFLWEKPSRRLILQRSRFLQIQARNCMQTQWKDSLSGRIRTNPPVFPYYRFLRDLQEIQTFNNLKMFLSRAFLTQKQIQTPPMQI